jgi:hypothetical protein
MAVVMSGSIVNTPGVTVAVMMAVVMAAMITTAAMTPIVTTTSAVAAMATGMVAMATAMAAAVGGIYTYIVLFSLFVPPKRPPFFLLHSCSFCSRNEKE